MGKKKQGGKKQAEASNQAPPPPETVSVITEAILNFKIHTREKLIEDREDEAETIRDKNYQQTDRNRKLLTEKESNLKALFDQVKTETLKSTQSKKIARNDVESLLLGNIDYLHSSQQEIQSMGETIKNLDDELAVNGKKLGKMRYYKDVILERNNSRIASINAKMKYIEQERVEQEAILNEQLKTIRDDVQKLTEVMIIKQQKEISERMLEALDPDVKKELRDNVWLKREIELQRKAFDKLSQENNFFEQRNLKLMDKIHKIKMADLEAMRKMCNPGVKLPPSCASPMPRLSSSNNLLSQQQAEDTSQGDPPMKYSSLEIRMMGVDGTQARLCTPPDSVRLPPLPGNKPQTKAAVSSVPIWPVTSRMLETFLSSDATS